MSRTWKPTYVGIFCLIVWVVYALFYCHEQLIRTVIVTEGCTSKSQHLQEPRVNRHLLEKVNIYLLARVNRHLVARGNRHSRDEHTVPTPFQKV